jgi:hypothetical protein
LSFRSAFSRREIVEAIAEGSQLVELTVEALTRRIRLSSLSLWRAQEQALGIE